MSLNSLKVVLRGSLYLLEGTDNWSLPFFIFSDVKHKCSKSGFYFSILKVSTSEIIPVGLIL